ncbi:hypothetical protein HGA64_02290 [Candidatus Falkowbacteria bacterium]|nr:hypothetical protein [Candidatus Falkowbacteria bacterium]
MSLTQIQDFLNSKGGFLATYRTTNSSGVMMSAAEIIYDRAVTNKVNPKFLIVLLQKEQSLIEKKNPTQNQLDWAVGYGCFDNQACNTRWLGFWKQVNSASLQFRDYMDNPDLYNYKPFGTYTVSNTGREPSVVTPQNRATAALYNYTPHVYNGNYNFYNIWQRYFPSQAASYPNGSLLQADGEMGVWLIQYGKRRAFTSRGALTTRYNTARVIKVTKDELNRYPVGAPIKFPQYALVRSPKGGIYLIVDNLRRPITSDASFRKLGFNPEEIVSASWEDLNGFEDGAPITATSTFPTGTLLQNKKTGGVYWVQDGQKAPIVDAAIMKTKFKNRKPKAVTPKELDAYKTVNPILFDDGELLKSNIGNSVFIIADGQKRPVTSGALFEKLGYKWDNVISVSPKVLYYYPEGQPMTLPTPVATDTTVTTVPATTTQPVNTQASLSTTTPQS